MTTRRTSPAKTAPAKATPARVRRPTDAELAAVSPVTPGQEVWEEPAELDPEVDFDLGSWRAQQGQQVEATRETIRFRLDDRRDGDHDPTYVVELPLLSQWQGKALRRLEAQTPAGIIDALGLASGDPDLVEVLDELTQEEVGAVLEHLINKSGVGPGESRPSGASSRSTRRR